MKFKIKQRTSFDVIEISEKVVKSFNNITEAKTFVKKQSIIVVSKECTHKYSDEITKDKSGSYRYLCTICKRHGHYKYYNEHEYWYDYDDKGNNIHWRDDAGHEVWNKYDDEGNLIYSKNNSGCEEWKHNGKWVNKKPLNWKYEK